MQQASSAINLKRLRSSWLCFVILGNNFCKFLFYVLCTNLLTNMIASSYKRSSMGHLNNEMAYVDFKSCLNGISIEWNFFLLKYYTLVVEFSEVMKNLF